MKTFPSIQDQVKAARAARGLSERALAERAGMGQPELWRALHSGSELKEATVARLAAALGVKLVIPAKAAREVRPDGAVLELDS